MGLANTTSLVGLEVEAAEPIVVFFICLQIKCVFLRGVARSSGARVSGVSNDWRARSRCVRAEGRVYVEAIVEVD